jgi:hypothetical protein
MKRDYVRDGYRVLFVGSHAVYYTVMPDTVHIIRVLHGSMDPDRHLESRNPCSCSFASAMTARVQGMGSECFRPLPVDRQ